MIVTKATIKNWRNFRSAEVELSDTTHTTPNEIGQQWFGIQCLSLSPANFIFRVCVREVEAWIMADRQAFADFLGISVTLLPQDMDGLDNPKQFLLNLIQTKCRKRCYRDMLPLPGQCIGINYNPMLTKFIRENWSPDRASSFAPSLRRSLSRIIETVRSYADTQQSRNIAYHIRAKQA